MARDPGIAAEPGERTPSHDALRTGWILVAIQAVLLIALIFLPRRGSLSLPLDLFDVIGIALMTGGLAIVLVALLSLGRALTANPVPVEGAGLRTGGIYALVRHPTYVGLILAGLGFTFAVGSIWQVVVLIILTGFLVGKASWEDRLLAEKYGIAWYDYADHVGGFIPRLRR